MFFSVHVYPVASSLLPLWFLRKCIHKGVECFEEYQNKKHEKCCQMHFAVVGKIAGGLFSKQKWGLDHQSVALEEVCGDRYVWEYIIYVLTNPSFCGRGRDGGSIKCLLVFLPST